MLNSSCKPYFTLFYSIWLWSTIQLTIVCTIGILLDVHSHVISKLNQYHVCEYPLNGTNHKIDNQWEFAVWLRVLKQGLCDNLEGWDGEGGDGVHGCTYGWFLLMLDRKQNSVKQLSFNLKNLKSIIHVSFGKEMPRALICFNNIFGS